MQLNALQKIFLIRKQVLNLGIIEVRDKRIKSLQRVLYTDKITIDYETAEMLDDFFKEDYAPDLINKIGSSNIFTLTVDSHQIPQYRRRKYFFEQIETYFLEGNDLDMKRKLGKFYRKYIKNR